MKNKINILPWHLTYAVKNIFTLERFITQIEYTPLTATEELNNIIEMCRCGVKTTRIMYSNIVKIKLFF